jgi:hypothetical protein
VQTLRPIRVPHCSRRPSPARRHDPAPSSWLMTTPLIGVTEIPGTAAQATCGCANARCRGVYARIGGAPGSRPAGNSSEHVTAAQLQTAIHAGHCGNSKKRRRPPASSTTQVGSGPKRRGGDSNPRSRFQDTAFPVLHNRPLCHLSVPCFTDVLTPVDQGGKLCHNSYHNT